MPAEKRSDFQIVLSELRQNRIRDLYVFEGEDAYLKNKLIEALEKLLIDPVAKELDRSAYDFSGKPSQGSVARICDEMETPAFLSVRKLIIVKDSGLFADSSSGISDVLLHVHDKCCIVFLEDKIDKRKKSLLTAVSAKGMIAEINRPDIDELRNWTIKEFGRAGIKVSGRIADIFAERNDRDLFSMENEAVKLQLFLKSSATVFLEEEHLDMIGSSDLKGSIFDLTDLISSGKTGNALVLLDSLISRKEPVQLIFFMFARHIKQLLCIKDIGNASKAASLMRIPPFVASKLISQAANIGAELLEQMYHDCAETDIAVKTSNLSDRTALEMLIAVFAERIRGKLN